MNKEYWIALTMLLLGCAPKEYKCAEDRRVINSVEGAYVVIVPRTNEPFNPSTFDEKKFEVVRVTEAAAAQNVPVGDYAMGYQDGLFCGPECAQRVLEAKNAEVEERIRLKTEEDRRDSLFLDSLRRGLVAR